MNKCYKPGIFLKLMLLVCCISPYLHAQSSAALDSMERALKTHKEDYTKLNLLNDVALSYSATNMAKANQYAQQGMELATQLHQVVMRGRFYTMLGSIAINEGKLDEALHYFQLARTDENNPGGRKWLSTISLNTGLVYCYKGDYPKAMQYFFLSLKEGAPFHNQKDAAFCYSNMGAIYQNSGNADSAIFYYNKSLVLRRAIKDTPGIATCVFNMGTLYSNQGRYAKAIRCMTEAAGLFEALQRKENLIFVYNNIAGLNRRVGNISKAMQYNQMALDLSEETGVKKYLSDIYYSRGVLYEQAGKFNESKIAYTKSLKLSQKAGRMDNAGESLVGLAAIARRQKNYALAEDYLKQALVYIKKTGIKQNLILVLMQLIDMRLEQKDTSGLKDMLAKTNQIINETQSTNQLREWFRAYAEYNMLAGKHKEAIQNYRQYATLSDSIFSEDMAQKFAELQTKYETEKKEKEITVLKQQKEIDALSLQKKKYQLGGTLAVLLLIIIGILAYLRRQKLERNLETQQRAIREMELKKKTVFETENKERERIAKDLHDELGSGMSKIILSNELAKKHINGNMELNYSLHSIDKTVQELSGNMKALIWSLYNENATLENLLVKMREFVGDFLEESDIEPTFYFPENVPSLPLPKEMLRDVFLSFKEAVNNAVKHAEATKIRLSVSLIDDQLEIQIADNGIGIDTDRKNGSGNGLENMRERMQRQKGTFKMKSRPGEGTLICFRIMLPVHKDLA